MCDLLFSLFSCIPSCSVFGCLYAIVSIRLSVISTLSSLYRGVRRAKHTIFSSFPVRPAPLQAFTARGAPSQPRGSHSTHGGRRRILTSSQQDPCQPRKSVKGIRYRAGGRDVTVTASPVW